MASYCAPIGLKEWSESEVESWHKPEELSAAPELKRIMAVFEILVRASAVEVESPLEERFREQAEKWERETGHISSVSKRAMHQSYQTIIGMGRDVVPILLRDLQQNQRDWFWALSAITQVNPISPADAGRVDMMTLAWLKWGKQKGLL